MSQDNIAVIRGMYESFSKGDVTSVLGQMHQHIEWREAENFIYADRAPFAAHRRCLKEFS
jgi:ketosteroid isomerase-like protein